MKRKGTNMEDNRIIECIERANYILGNLIYLIMVVMRRTDVKTAPGEDSWRSCFT